MKRIILQRDCNHCKKIFETKKEHQKFCSRECKNEDQRTSNLGRKMPKKFGKDNPNFGKKWSEEKKKKQSEIVKSKVNDEYREKAGSANRGVKFTQDRIDKMHSHRSFESYSRPHTEETKTKLAITSRERFKNPEFSKKFRNTMEERGHWIPKEIKGDWDIYLNLSNWKYRMFDLLSKEYSDIMKFGVYNSFKNTKGVVRDHKFSRKSGLDLRVFPELIRHIENCEIMLHSDNIRKRHRNKDSISLEELFVKIETTEYEWDEQALCIQLIKDYRNGKRWNRKEV